MDSAYQKIAEVSKVIDHILLICFLLTLPSLCFSQTQKGAILGRGAVTINLDNVKLESNNVKKDLGAQNKLHLDISGGYFIVDGIAIGLSLDWNREVETDNNDVLINSSTSIGPFVRYYTALGPYFQGGFSLGGGSVKIKPETGPNLEYPVTTSGWNLGIGYPYYLSDHVSIEPLLLFSSNNIKQDINEEETLHYRGLRIEVGFVYYFF